MKYLGRVLNSLSDECYCNISSGYACEVCQYKIYIDRAEDRTKELQYESHTHALYSASEEEINKLEAENLKLKVEIDRLKKVEELVLNKGKKHGIGKGLEILKLRELVKEAFKMASDNNEHTVEKEKIWLEKAQELLKENCDE